MSDNSTSFNRVKKRARWQLNLIILAKLPRNILFCGYFIAVYFSRIHKIPIVVFPDRPLCDHTLWNICCLLGLRMVGAPPDHQHYLQVRYDIETYSLSDIPRKFMAGINLDCTDIGKDRVQRVFHQTFGYSLEVDPATYSGLIVKKSVLNALRDGEMLRGPVDQVDSGKVYQKFIDSRNSDTAEAPLVDLRTLVIGETIPFVVLKGRMPENRFISEYCEVSWAETDDIFSGEEQKQIVKFVKTMGLSFCELDIVRDLKDGRIYIVDANSTPSGPTTELRNLTGLRLMHRAAKAFSDTFLTDPSNVPAPVSQP